MPRRLLTLIVVLGAVLIGTVVGGAAGGWSRRADVSITVLPSRAFTRGLCTLRLKTGTLLADESIRWTSSAGRLLYDDLPEVLWRAPERPGKVVIEVALERRGRARGARVEVEIHIPSTEGMLWIPPSTFLCGDTEGTRDPFEVKTVECANDEPCHDVYLDGYWIDRHLVTNRLYARFLQSALAEGLVRIEDVGVIGDFEGEWVPYYYFRPYHWVLMDFYEVHNARKPAHLHRISVEGEEFRVEAGHEDEPVVDVSWYGAVAYARYYGHEMPTEAQWEKAARGVDGRRYPWGENLPTRFHAPLDLRLAPVGTFSPAGDSPYGMADVLAGCFEWTNDWFNAEYYADYLGKTPHRNPRGPFWGQAHAIRGFSNFVRYEVDAVNKREPLCLRYQWFFEFVLGDIFADRLTGFRTVVAPPRERTDGR